MQKEKLSWKIAYTTSFPCYLISHKNISCVNLVRNIIKAAVIAVSYDRIRHLFEFVQIVDDLGTVEGRAVLKRRLINDNCCVTESDALHNALDRALAVKLL